MRTVNNQTAKQKIITYFEGAGLDYYYWDKAFNMHFGYYNWGMNPLNLPALLNQMNQEALNRLHLDGYENPLVLDLGCGLGATSRYMAIANAKSQFCGFTITPWQVNYGNQLSKEVELPCGSIGMFGKKMKIQNSISRGKTMPLHPHWE